jgi:hypothetical protein
MIYDRAMRATALLVLAPLLVAACSAGGEPTMPPLNRGPVPAELFASMVGRAAQQAGVDRSQVSVVTAESVTWRDGSLGCPEPGRMYTQALVPGYRVILAAGGRQFHFHASRQGNYELCPPERVQEPAPGLDT